MKNLGPPRLIFILIITFDNGNEMHVLSDQTWTGREGSIKHDSVYNGEIYDSRSDRLNWSCPGFNDSLSAWIIPEPMPSPINMSSNGLLVLQDMPPIRAGPDALHFEVILDSQQQENFLKSKDISEIKGAKLTDRGVLKPIAMWESDSGTLSVCALKDESVFYLEFYIGVRTFDLGQNIAGWCRLRFHGPSGFGVYIRHGEILTQPVVTTK